MWYNKFTFYNKKKGLLDQNPEKIWNNEFSSLFFLPDELFELLKFSNGGGIINGEREFGYFSLTDIEKCYFEYNFSKYTPSFLPIAFNGGGIFYAYDFRHLPNITIVAVAAGVLEYKSSIVIGNTLNEVLSKTSDIILELDELYPAIEITENVWRLIELRKELNELNNNRNSIETKEYLLTKRKLEFEINRLTS